MRPWGIGIWTQKILNLSRFSRLKLYPFMIMPQFPYFCKQYLVVCVKWVMSGIAILIMMIPIVRMPLIGTLIALDDMISFIFPIKEHYSQQIVPTGFDVYAARGHCFHECF